MEDALSWLSVLWIGALILFGIPFLIIAGAFSGLVGVLSFLDYDPNKKKKLTSYEELVAAHEAAKILTSDEFIDFVSAGIKVELEKRDRSVPKELFDIYRTFVKTQYETHYNVLYTEEEYKEKHGVMAVSLIPDLWLLWVKYDPYEYGRIYVRFFLDMVDRLPMPEQHDAGSFKFSVPVHDLVKERRALLLSMFFFGWYSGAANMHVFVTFRDWAHSVLKSKFDTDTYPNVILPDRIPNEVDRLDDREIYDKLLAGTTWAKLLDYRMQLVVPEKVRFEHTWLLAPPGTGKTQTIQYLVSRDLEKVENEEASVVIMDAHHDLIHMVKSLKVFAPDNPLHEKLIVLEPDPDHPISLNMFDMSGIENHGQREKERLTNNALENLTYVFSTLGAEGAYMTPMQNTLYRYVIRLLMRIPNATLHTFAAILQPKGLEPYTEQVKGLDDTARNFFDNQFNTSQFNRTKQEVAWRLSLMMENRTFDRMFSAPTNRLNLFEELNSAKVILIDTDKELLGDMQTMVLGRFFIAMLLSVAQQRASLKKRLPVFCYIDEAHDYVKADQKMANILDQTRKMNIAMLLANQRSSQITDPNVLDAMVTTGTKLVSTDNPRDASLLAKNMKTTPEFISNQPKRHFALSVRGVTDQAVSVEVPFFVMEKMEKMDDAERQIIRDRMIERYSVVAVEPVEEEIPEEPEEEVRPYQPPQEEEIVDVDFEDIIDGDFEELPDLPQIEDKSDDIKPSEEL